MRHPLRLTPLPVLWLALVALPAQALADPIRLVAADDRGVTIRFTLPPLALEPGPDGRSELRVPGLRVADIPGRPQLPYASTLIALPPGARATARLVDDSIEEEQGGMRLAIAARPVFIPEAGGRDFMPARDPVAPMLDGPWPMSPVQVGEPFTLRRQRMVAVTLSPFRYDEASSRLWTRRGFTVRVDFVGRAETTQTNAAPATEDRHWEPVLRQGLLNYEQGRAWRERARPATRGGAPGSSLFEQPAGSTRMAQVGGEDFAEVRIKVDTTGVIQFAFDDLVDFGYPAAVPVDRVSVHRHEFVENTVPPYVTIELPIEVDDANGSGFFDSGDRVIVFVQSWAERSGASIAQRDWGDAEVVYATAVAGSGLRVAQRPGWRSVAGLTPLASYPWTQRWEQTFGYMNFPADTVTDQFHWTDITPYYIRDTYPFETNHIDPTRPTTFAVTWQGRRDMSHFSWAEIRNGAGPYVSIADSVSWFGRIAKTVSAPLPGTMFGEGNVNTLRIWGKGSGLPDPVTNAIDNAALNYYEATYWRSYRALRGYLPCNSGDAAGEAQVLAAGFATNDVRVYDVTDPLNPVRLALDPSHVQPSGSEFTVEFQDSVAAGSPHRYVVFTRGKIPPASHVTAVTRRQLTNRSTGDYLLIVPEAFLPAVAPLVALRQSQGLDVVVSPLESVCDEFNGGRKSSYAIKRFVRHAYENWNAKFVLLVGDGSEDPLNLMQQTSPDWIPIHKIQGPVGITFGLEIVPSDPWYVCMTNCDLRFAVPVLQDLFIGRLPVQSLSQAQEVIAKLVAYENFAADQTWRNTLLLLADDEYSGATFFGGGSGEIGYCRRAGERVFRQLNETIGALVTQAAGLRQTTLDVFNLGYFLRNEPFIPPPNVFSDTCRPSSQDTQKRTHASVTPELISRLNAGRLWWNYQGHANEFVLAHEDLYLNRGSNDDKDVLANDGKPFIFSAFSCHANAFAHQGDLGGSRGPSLGEEMVTLPNRGAIASWASSGFEILPGNGVSHINVAWANAMFNQPPHDEYLGDKGARVVLGETIALAVMDYVPGVLFNPNERGAGLTYQLLGDPATRISIGAPQASVTANGLPVVDDQVVRLHTLGDTLRLEADLVSNTQLTSLALERTDASATVVIPAGDYTVTPAFPDTGASGTGGRSYRLTYRTTLAPASYRYTFRTTDRYDVVGQFDAVFQFLTQLKLGGAVLADGDPVPPEASLELQILSPKPLNPGADLTLTVNGTAQAFTASPAPGDGSGREWILTWSHSPYSIGTYEVRLTVAGGSTYAHQFRVVSEVRLRNALAFPNPFDDDLGTYFSFDLEAAADVQIRVYTASGRLVYQRIERGLSPPSQQLRWDGRDDEGQKLANGIYLYRIVASNGETSATHEGRLVKLRKPRRGDPQSTP